MKKSLVKTFIFILIILAVGVWAYFDPDETIVKGICGFALITLNEYYFE